MFRQAAEKIAEKFEAADGRSFEFGRTRVRFPGPVPHGEGGSELGWVLPCVVEKSSVELMTVARKPFRASASTWSFMSEMSGLTTRTVPRRMRAAIWKVTDWPA